MTGNLGYVGTILTEILTRKDYSVTGLDVKYFKECLLEPASQNIKQINKDIREIVIEDIIGFDAIIHLAGLSNDPLGELNPGLTEEINFHGTVNLAKIANQAGVKRFIYASSQSMYGISETDHELDEDNSEKNPVTAYARTKWEAELILKKMNDQDFTVTCFRPSTVFGVSPRLRCDIVYNNLVACAYTTGKIEILSDGTPWRPVVHVRDVCQAFVAGLEAPIEIIGGRAFNVGLPNGNFTIRQLAEAAQRSVPDSTLTFTGEHGNDARTYQVSFNRILTELAEYYKPEWDLDNGGRELVKFFKETGLTESDFRGRKTTRLEQLFYLQSNHVLNNQMRFRNEIQSAKD